MVDTMTTGIFNERTTKAGFGEQYTTQKSRSYSYYKVTATYLNIALYTTWFMRMRFVIRLPETPKPFILYYTQIIMGRVSLMQLPVAFYLIGIYYKL